MTITCPECGNLLQEASSSGHVAGGRFIKNIHPGCWCHSCGYGALSKEYPNIPHPMSLPYSERQKKHAAQAVFEEIVETLADILPNIERIPRKCGGQPTFKGSRLTLSTIIACLIAGEPDEDILKCYPDLDQECLDQIKAAWKKSEEE